MQISYSIFSAFALLMASTASQAASLDDCNKHLDAFQNNPKYSVTVYQGKIAPKVIFDEKTSLFKSQFREVIPWKKEVSFAGHYGATILSCGPICNGVGLVNLKTGKAINGPIYSLNIEFKPTSRIMVTDRPKSQDQVNLMPWLFPSVYLLNNDGLLEKIYECKLDRQPVKD